MVGTVVLAVLILYWLFLSPHGLADNGDFYRSIHNFGLSHFPGEEKFDLFQYFNHSFALSDHYVDNTISYCSSQGLLLWLSIQLNRLFYSSSTYDIRFLAGLYAGLYLATSYQAIRLLRNLAEFMLRDLSKRTQMLMAWFLMAGYLFIFGDFGYLLYFNSFFGEPMFFAFFLLFVVSAASLLKKRGNACWWDFLIFVISSVLFVSAKQQGAPLGIFVALFIFRLTTLKPERKWKAACSTAAVCVILTSLLTYVKINEEIQYINKYHSMTVGVMKYAADAKELKELNVPPQLYFLKGSTVYDEYPMVLPDSPLLYHQMYDRVSPIKIGVYYLQHPNEFYQLADNAARASYLIKPEMLGNYLRSSGNSPSAKSYFFSGWSLLKPHIFPKTFGFLMVFLVALACAVGVRHVKWRKDRQTAGTLSIEFIWCIELMAVTSFLIAFLGAGEADLAKHLFYFSVMADLLAAYAAFEIICAVLHWYSDKKSLCQAEKRH
jgi:hypothetical protein